MATLASAREKYARKTGPGSPAVAKFNAAKGRMKTNFRSGMNHFMGQPVSGAVAAAYDAGVDAAQYGGGDPDKWQRNYLAAMTGG